MNRIAFIAVALVAIGSLGACSSGPAAQEIDWGNLPDGTMQYVTTALDNEDCGPIRSVGIYVNTVEADNPTPTTVQEFLSNAYDDLNCGGDNISDFLDSMTNGAITMDRLDQLSTPDVNPLYFGPGCIGTLGTLDAMHAPEATDDLESVSAKTLLATTAILDGLPPEVTKTGSRVPTQAEDVAMAVAAAFVDLGEVLLDTSPDATERLQTVMDRLNFLETQAQIACYLEYQDGPQPSTGVIP